MRAAALTRLSIAMPKPMSVTLPLPSTRTALLLLFCCLPLAGCVATVAGAAVAGAVAVGSAVVVAPFKIGGAIVEAVADDDEAGDDDEENPKAGD